MSTPSYLTETQLREDTEFPQVLAKTSPQLARYIFRAHAIAESHGPFVVADDLDDATVVASINGTDYTERALFLQDMRTALGLIVESLVFRNTTRPAAAAGLTHEKIGSYEYSRSAGASGVGEPVQAEILTSEIMDIFERWRLGAEGSLISRTDVFLPTEYVDVHDPSRKIVVEEDFSRLSPTARNNGTGGSYRAPFG